MDIKQSLDYRYQIINEHNIDGNNRYNYEKNGILNIRL